MTVCAVLLTLIEEGKRKAANGMLEEEKAEAKGGYYPAGNGWVLLLVLFLLFVIAWN